MMRIDRLRLRLPPMTANRAEMIARRVAEGIAASNLHENMYIERIAIPRIHVSSDAAAGQIATLISTAVISEIRGGDA